MKPGLRTSLTQCILSLSAAGLSVQTFLQSGSALQWHYVAVVFFSTWLIYRVAWYGLKRPFKPHAFSKAVIAFSTAGIAFFSISLSSGEVAGLIVMLLFCLIYFAEKGKWKGLRSVTFVKSIWVALVWTVVTAWIPLSFSLEKNAVLLVTERFLYMSAVCLIYNLRDVQHDFSKGITTVPKRYGVTTTKSIAVFQLLAGAALVIDHGYPLYIVNALLISISASILVSLLAVPDGNWLYYTLAVDGSMLLQAALVIIFYVQNSG